MDFDWNLSRFRHDQIYRRRPTLVYMKVFDLTKNQFFSLSNMLQRLKRTAEETEKSSTVRIESNQSQTTILKVKI